jgi:N-acetylmuramoyl-L-alanine amidase
VSLETPGPAGCHGPERGATRARVDDRPFAHARGGAPGPEPPCGAGVLPLKLRVLKGFARQARSYAARRLVGGAVLALVPVIVAASPEPLTVLTSTGRRQVPAVTREGPELVAIEDVARGFGVKVTTDRRSGAGTLAVGAHEVGLYDGKSLASVDGDLRLLSAPVHLEGGRWLVPVDGVPRLLEPLLGQPVEWRASERVLVVGHVSVPSISVRASESGNRARIVFEASEPVPFRVEQGQHRIHVTVSRDVVDVTMPGESLQGGIVDSIRFVGGRTNLFVVHLGSRFRKAHASQQESPPRLILDLEGEAAPTAPARPAPARAEARPSPRPPAPADGALIRTVVIDPGHGGANVGAQGPAGTLEKDVSLAIARRLRTDLVNALGLQVFLTRDHDEDVNLDQRTAIANNYKADLFISIHANASRARGARGSEVYFLSYQASDDDARRIAQLEGAAEPYGPAPPGSDLAIVLWDMAQAEHLEESSALATRIQDELAGVTGAEGRGVKQAPFRVLVGATMPAVLVEVAFISNPEEEKELSSDTYQSKIAAALMRGIARYRQERAARLGGAATTGGRP